MYCKKCGSEIPEGSKMCTDCGTSMYNIEMTCAKCLAKIPVGYDGCPVCAQKKKDNKLSERPSNGAGLLVSGTGLIFFGILVFFIMWFVGTADMPKTAEDSSKILYLTYTLLAGGIFTVPGIILMGLGFIQKTLYQIYNNQD